jgi:integration host factor subunit beta
MMTKSELIDLIARQHNLLPPKDVEMAVNLILESMTEALADNERIEIRGFGSFTLHHRKARMGRNPKTGEAVSLNSKRAPHFKPGKEMRDRINASQHIPLANK